MRLTVGEIQMKKTLFLSLALLSLPLAAFASDELWVGSYFGDNIQRYDLTSGSSLGMVGAGKLDGTLGMTIGPDGSVYVCSELTGSLEKFDRNGAWLGRFATANSPTAVTFDKDGKAYVGQFDIDSVAKYSSTGSPLGSFVLPGSGGLDGPDIGATFGPDGNLYVPSFNSGDVLRYNGTTGAFIDKFIPSGSGGLSQPRQIIWRNGAMYVTSDNGNKVLRYDASTGTYIDTFIAANSGGLNGATGMVFYKDSVYITSWRNNRVLKFDATSGAYQGDFVASGLSGPVSLLVVPEPSAVIGLAGGLALLLRQKKR
ncbi:MAG: PEP-CTERM sorting domain-containing protein [Armatimonadetes bacterium]|nr:PEP-CTERM sorting domain-containing protein [Armatimonadota bacterium]